MSARRTYTGASTSEADDDDAHRDVSTAQTSGRASWIPVKSLPAMPSATKMGHMGRPIFSVTPGYGDHQLREFHYAQAVRYGDRIETAGQGGWDEGWHYPESVRDEIIQAFDNVEQTLATTGASWRDVVHVHSYHVPDPEGHIGREHLDTMVDQFRRRMGDRAPLWTCIGVAALASPQMRVEIQVTAVDGS